MLRGSAVGFYRLDTPPEIPSEVDITTTSLSGGTQNTAYSQPVSATGGITPYVWSISSGGLPNGLSINSSSGTISGTPTVAGVFTFTLTVLDAISQSAAETLSIAVQVAPTPPAGTIIFDGNMEVANVLSQWTSIANGNPNRVLTVTAENGVTPRHGSRMLRCDAWPGEYASWSPTTLQAAIVQKNSLPGTGLGNDIYAGGSFYIVPGYQYASAVAHNTFVEWHGVGPMSQAPIHLGVLGNGGAAGQFFLDLHRATTGYAPIFQVALGPIITGSWIDYVIRTKWENDSTGKATLWLKVADGDPMDAGDIKHDYSGPTNPLTNEAIYPVIGLYRGTTSALGTVYHDSYKVGTTLAVVDPGSYD